MLTFDVESEDILLVSGPIGSGKSVAIRSFIAALDPNRFAPIYLRGLGLSATDLVKSIMLSLLIEPPYNIPDHLRPVRSAGTQENPALFPPRVGASENPSLGRFLGSVSQGYLRIYRSCYRARWQANSAIF